MPAIEHLITVCAAARLEPVPLVPEVTLYTAEDAYAVWELTTLGTGEAPVPYWSFPWAGGQALARHILDHPAIARDRRVLDLAAGSGLVALAAMKAGAAAVIANDIDPFAAAAQELNARANGVRLEAVTADVLDRDPAELNVDIIVAADVCYERELTRRIVAFLHRAAECGAQVLLADPGRTYLPRTGLERIADYDVPTTLAIEGSPTRRTTIWRPVSVIPAQARPFSGSCSTPTR